MVVPKIYLLLGIALQPIAFANAAVMLEGSSAFEPRATLQDDLKSLGFNVTVPNDLGYRYVSTPFNLRFNTIKPAAVAFPSSTKQVSDVIKVVAKHNYQVVSRSGGHGYTANGLGGKSGLVVIDLRHLNSITLDKSTNRTTIKPGALLGNVAHTLANSGRVMPHGTCPLVGLGGHISFGGYGFLSRKYGLLLDNVVKAEVVLSNGTIATVSRDQNADLFWALRGSAPSFGILTSITATTYPMPSSVTTFEYGWTVSASDLSKAIGNFQTFAAKADLPPELSADLGISAGSKAGVVTLSLSGGFYAANSKFNAAISPLLNTLPKPSWSTVQPGTYKASVDYFARYSWGKSDTFYAKSLLTPADAPLNAQARTAFANYIANTAFSAKSGTNWWILLATFGGSTSKINQVPTGDASFAHRKSLLSMQFYASSQSGKPPFPAAGLTLIDGMVNSIVSNSPAGTKFGAYANYIDERLTNWQTMYYGDNYPRLQQLKAKYDAKDIFSFPQSIAKK